MSNPMKKGPKGPKDATTDDLDLDAETVIDLEPAEKGARIRGGVFGAALGSASRTMVAPVAGC